MTIQNQRLWVIARLNRYGRVTRNQALNQGITRLASIICKIRQAGIETIGRKAGKDYQYSLEIK